MPCAAADAVLSSPAAEDSSTGSTYIFDLPSLPLGMALKRYNDLTRHSVLYESHLVEGKTAAPLRGRYTPAAALDRLLQGSGLAANFVTPRSATLAAVQAGHEALATRPETGSAAQRRYDGRMQQRIAWALCTGAVRTAWSERIALRFNVNGAHRIDDVAVRIASRPDMEPAVKQALDGLLLGVPPAGMKQPVVLLVRAGEQGEDCPS
ncbi:Outer membrane TonB-dependent transducer VreA of trans-envelope signaling system [plant metagenome]|uniref:Outer membrane TonB-dependent transducer VreA of trans-envelope signaling system n=1 Tax=plant metagenome TaxID=1297885 RepID=A0A484Q4C6_9ZZZZ